MTRCQIIVECSSNHGGDLSIAKDMIWAAADHGADWVKFQAYRTAHLSPRDSQFAWLKKAELAPESILELARECKQAQVKPLFSAFDQETVWWLDRQGLRVKLGHASRHLDHPINAIVSYAWGREIPHCPDHMPLAVIPLYPAPLSAVSALEWKEGWGYSDHCEGLLAAKLMVARGAVCLEKHFSIEGCPRHQSWDMNERQLWELRQWVDVCAKVSCGTNSNRWEFVARPTRGPVG